MADSYLAYENPSTTDKKLDSESLTVGANTVERERIQIAGTAATDIAPVSATDGLLVNLGANNDVTVAGVATSAKQDTIIGHVDGIETLLGTIDTDTGNISTKIDTLAGAVSGTEMQVDVLTVPADPFGANADAAATAGSTGSIQAKLRLMTSQLDSIKTAVETLDNTVAGSELQVDVLTMPTVTVNAHAVTNAGTFAVQVDGSALTALQLIDNIVLAEDAAHVSADAGIQALAVRTDSPANKSGTDGDYEPLQVSGGLLWTRLRGIQTPNGDSAMDDVNDAVRVNVVTGSTAGTQYTEADTDASITGTAVMWEDTGDTLRSASVATPLPVQVAGYVTNDNARTKLVDSGGSIIAHILDLTTYNALAVAIVDGNGDQITSFGGGTQYTEDAAAAANPVGTALMLVREDARAGGLTTTDGDNVAARGNNKGELYVLDTDVLAKLTTIDGRVDGIEGLLTTIDADTGNISTKIDTIAGAVSGTEMQVDVLTMPTVTVNAHAVTNAGTFVVQENGAALTALQLIDDTVFAEDVAAQAADKGIAILAVRRDADTSLVGTDNDYANLQVDANGYLKVEIFDGGGSHTVDNAGTFAVQVDGNALTALQLIDDIVYTDDTSTHSTGSSKGALMMAAAAPTDTAVNANDIGAVGMTVNRELYVSLTTALPAGTNGIGKLTANSGVDIGDVDVTSVTPGTTASALGKAEDAGHTTGDVGVMMLGVRTDTPSTARADTDLDYAPIAVYRTGAVRTAIPEEDFAALGSNHVKKYYTNAGAVTDGIIWSPAAGKRWYVTDIFINVSAAATVTLEDDKAGGDEVVWKAELAANSGWSHHYGTPLFSGEDAADLMVTTSAGNVYITVTGYEI